MKGNSETTQQNTSTGGNLPLKKRIKKQFFGSKKNANNKRTSIFSNNVEPESPTLDASKKHSHEEPTLELTIRNFTYSLKAFKSGGICQILHGKSNQDGARDVSVKMVQEKWRNNPNVRRQFSIESQIMRDLAHPSLPKYLCRGVVNNQSYYAYEFIDGIQLINLSQRPDLFPKNIVSGLALSIIKQALGALDFLHSRLNPIVHGDISSENILINHQQQIYLLDFGCAHYLKMHGLNAKKWVGKPSFISPEQAKNQPWDHRSDLYQVGILYYELITGKRWNRGTDKETKHQFAANAPTPKLDFLAHIVPIPVSMILAKMLHADPKQRFQSAAEALNALNSMRRYQPKKSFIKTNT